MSESGLPPSVFYMLEKNVGRRVSVVLGASYGFEGKLIAVTHDPPGIWLSDADAIILRASIAKPIPQVVGKEDRSEVFINLNSVQRIEVLHENK